MRRALIRAFCNLPAEHHFNDVSARLAALHLYVTYAVGHDFLVAT